MAQEKKKRTRLMVDISPELRRRIKVAAAQRDVSVKDYVVDLLELNVSLDNAANVSDEGIITADKLAHLDQIRKQVMRGRKFKDDSTDFINEAREDRTAEL